MPTVFRITARDGNSIGEAETIDGAVELVRGAPPGRYRIDNVSLDRDTGEVRSWEWGAVTKGRKGGIKLDVPPWFH